MTTRTIGRDVRLSGSVVAIKEIGAGSAQSAKVWYRKLVAAGAALCRKHGCTPAEASAYYFENHRALIQRIRDGGIKVSRASLAGDTANYLGQEDVNAKAKAREAERVETYRRLTGRDLVADEREQALREKRAKTRTF
jgi:hypothetical protein